MKKSFTIVLIAIIFFLEKGMAQFATVWTANYQHTTANNFSNESRKVVTDASGNSYVLADVTSNKDPNGIITTLTYHYTVLAKYSTTGALLASTTIKVYEHVVSGFDNLGAFGLELSGSNSIFIGYTTHDPTKNFDVNVAKYNSSLTLQWVRTYNPASSDVGVDMTIYGATVYALVKSVSGATTTYGIIKGNSNVVNDTLLYRFPATHVMNAITTGAGAIYATGYKTIGNYKNVMTVKLNSAGSFKWSNSYDGGLAGDDYGKDIAFGSDGYIYVTGSSWRGAPNNFDMLVMKLNDQGSSIWSRYRDDKHHNDVGLFIDARDLDYVYGGSTSGNNVILNQFETMNGILGGSVVYSPMPVSPYVSLSGIELNDFKVSINHGFYLCGSVLATDAQGRLYSAEYLAKFVFASPTVRDAFTLDSAMPVAGDYANTRAGVSISFDYSKDDVIWLTDLVSDNGTHNQETVIARDLSMTSPIREGNSSNSTILSSREISISPNPSSDLIAVSSGEKITKIELFDLTGKTVKSITAASEKVTMDISGLMNGIYIGRIYSESGTATSRKIIKN